MRKSIQRWLLRVPSVHLIGEHAADVHGDLTMHGMTRPVVIHVELLSPAKSTSDTLSWKITAHLRRSEFGSAMESGD